MPDGIRGVVLTPIMYFPHTGMYDGVLQAIQRYPKRDVWFHPVISRTIIHTARNRLLHAGMADHPSADRFIFLDSDMLVPSGDLVWWRAVGQTTLPDRFGAINFFERAMGYDIKTYGIIGATYVDRKVGRDFQCSRGVGAERTPTFGDEMRAGKYRGLLPCSWVGTGGFVVGRWVIEKLIANAERWPEVLPTKHGQHHGFFQHETHNTGEDVTMCKLAGELGIRVFLDTDLRLLHCGEKWY